MEFPHQDQQFLVVGPHLRDQFIEPPLRLIVDASKRHINGLVHVSDVPSADDDSIVETRSQDRGYAMCAPVVST